MGGGQRAGVLPAWAPWWQLMCVVRHRGEGAEGMGDQTRTIPPGAGTDKGKRQN